MKITVGQLRRLIRESVEEETRERLDEGLLDWLKDFFGFGVKKVPAAAVNQALGRWPGYLPSGLEDFQELFSKFPAVDDDFYDQEFVWKRLIIVTAFFFEDIFEGRVSVSSSSMRLMKKVAVAMEKRKKPEARISLIQFIKLNSDEILQRLSNDRMYREVSEKTDNEDVCDKCGHKLSAPSPSLFHKRRKKQHVHYGDKRNI